MKQGVRMVWVVEKKVVYHFLDVGFESVEIPVRVKFEFEVKEGGFLPDSLSVDTLYNRKALERRYPRLNVVSFESSIDTTVKREIFSYLRECGYVHEQNGRQGGEL